MAKTAAIKEKSTTKKGEVKTGIITGEDAIPKVLADVMRSVNEKNKSRIVRSALDILKDAKIEIKLPINTDATDKDNNIKVIIRWNPENGWPQSREVNINAACDSEDVINNVLTNMGFLDNKGEVSRAVNEVVIDKVRQLEFSPTHDQIGWETFKGLKIFKLHKIH